MVTKYNMVQFVLTIIEKLFSKSHNSSVMNPVPLMILFLALMQCSEGTTYPQPTSLPTSLFVAPSIPEDISSQLIDQPKSTSPPTIDSRQEDFRMHSKISAEDEYATTSEYMIGIIGIVVVATIGYFVWKK